MFENLKITAIMSNGISTIDPIRLDCILSAAKAKEILQEEYYFNGKQAGDAERVISTLSSFLEYSDRVFHASYAHIECDKEYVVSYSKRWNGGHDELVKFVGKGKAEIDTARGTFKSYHKSLIYKPCKQVVFFARGDKQKISQLLNDYIAFIGKKSSQGFGAVREWIVDVIDNDYSLIHNNIPMRCIPVTNFINKVDVDSCSSSEQAIIPPSWRSDCRELCFEPDSE